MSGKGKNLSLLKGDPISREDESSSESSSDSKSFDIISIKEEEGFQAHHSLEKIDPSKIKGNTEHVRDISQHYKINTTREDLSCNLSFCEKDNRFIFKGATVGSARTRYVLFNLRKEELNKLISCFQVFEAIYYDEVNQRAFIQLLWKALPAFWNNFLPKLGIKCKVAIWATSKSPSVDLLMKFCEFEIFRNEQTFANEQKTAFRKNHHKLDRKKELHKHQLEPEKFDYSNDHHQGTKHGKKKECLRKRPLKEVRGNNSDSEAEVIEVEAQTKKKVKSTHDLGHSNDFNHAEYLAYFLLIYVRSGKVFPSLDALFEIIRTDSKLNKEQKLLYGFWCLRNYDRFLIEVQYFPKALISITDDGEVIENKAAEEQRLNYKNFAVKEEVFEEELMDIPKITVKEETMEEEGSRLKTPLKMEADETSDKLPINMKAWITSNPSKEVGSNEKKTLEKEGPTLPLILFSTDNFGKVPKNYGKLTVNDYTFGDRRFEMYFEPQACVKDLMEKLKEGGWKGEIEISGKNGILSPKETFISLIESKKILDQIGVFHYV